MLKRIMDLKGKIPKNVIKKGAVWKNHFDENLDFKFVDKDSMTGEEITRVITDNNCKRELKEFLLDRVGPEKQKSQEREDWGICSGKTAKRKRLAWAQHNLHQGVQWDDIPVNGPEPDVAAKKEQESEESSEEKPMGYVPPHRRCCKGRAIAWTRGRAKEVRAYVPPHRRGGSEGAASSPKRAPSGLQPYKINKASRAIMLQEMIAQSETSLREALGDPNRGRAADEAEMASLEKVIAELKEEQRSFRHREREGHSERQERDKAAFGGRRRISRRRERRALREEEDEELPEARQRIRSLPPSETKPRSAQQKTIARLASGDASLGREARRKEEKKKKKQQEPDGDGEGIVSDSDEPRQRRTDILGLGSTLWLTLEHRLLPFR
eukprot:s526_g27.t1